MYFLTTDPFCGADPIAALTCNLQVSLQHWSLLRCARSNMALWRDLGISSWPTLVVVSPRGRVLATLPG